MWQQEAWHCSLYVMRACGCAYCQTGLNPACQNNIMAVPALTTTHHWHCPVQIGTWTQSLIFHSFCFIILSCCAVQGSLDFLKTDKTNVMQGGSREEEEGLTLKQPFAKPLPQTPSSNPSLAYKTRQKRHVKLQIYSDTQNLNCLDGGVFIQTLQNHILVCGIGDYIRKCPFISSDPLHC